MMWSRVLGGSAKARACVCAQQGDGEEGAEAGGSAVAMVGVAWAARAGSGIPLATLQRRTAKRGEGGGEHRGR